MTLVSSPDHHVIGGSPQHSLGMLDRMAALRTEDGDVLRIDTAQHTWCFDMPRRRFCRVPRGTDPRDPAFEATWSSYWDLSRAEGTLTVVLDRAGTLRLRVVD